MSPQLSWYLGLSAVLFTIGVVGVLMMPWKLVADPNGYIFVWLIAYSALLGPKSAFQRRPARHDPYTVVRPGVTSSGNSDHTTRTLVYPRPLRGFDEGGRTRLPGQLHGLDSGGREDAAGRHRPSARLRRGFVQVGTDGSV